MGKNIDAIIVGGGHNGLTAAGYLGKAGLKTLVLERRPILGGAVVTEEICPGYRISSVSYVVSLLRPEIIRDLELHRHGFEMIRMAGSLAVCDDNYLFLNNDERHDRKEVGRFSSCDYDAMLRFDGMVQTIGEVVRNQMLQEPPKLDAGFHDLLAFFRMGLDVRRLSPDMRYRLLQMLTGSAHDFIEHWFDSPMVKAMYASACFSGNFASLRQPGSAIPFFHSAIGEIEGASLVRVQGKKNGKSIRLDNYINAPGLTEAFEKYGITHESFLTGQSAFLFAKLYVNDKISLQGVFPPEALEASAREYYLKEAAGLGITVDEIIETSLFHTTAG